MELRFHTRGQPPTSSMRTCRGRRPRARGTGAPPAPTLEEAGRGPPPPRPGAGRNARLELVSAERGYSPQRESLTQALSILAYTGVLALLVVCGHLGHRAPLGDR